MGPTEHIDDAVLVARCREGDESAWRMLVHRYKGLVYSAALRTGIDEEGAADVFQQVWVELHRSLDRLRDPQALPRWLAVTSRRIAYKVGTQRHQRVEGVLEEMVDPAQLPVEELEALQRLHRLQELVDSLGRSCSRLLTLLFLDPAEPSYKEIADNMGISIGSIGPKRARCLARLRSRLEEGA